MSVIKLEENFYCIDDPGSRQFFFVGKDKVILVDTGFGKSEITPIIREGKIIPDEIEMWGSKRKIYKGKRVSFLAD